METVESLRRSIVAYARTSSGRRWERLSPAERYRALALAVRERIVERALETEERQDAVDPKRVHYLSLEFLPGRILSNNLTNLGLRDEVDAALRELGTDLARLEEVEADPALGNGGLGRLAACFLDSLASLGYPAQGYGINYDFGLFRQRIVGGEQQESPDAWKTWGTPWLLARPDDSVTVPLFGRVVDGVDEQGGYEPRWLDQRSVIGVPFDLPVVGFGGRSVVYLRLFTARSVEEFDMEVFNRGDYVRAVEVKAFSETVSKVLYPNDERYRGKGLRLIQEHFFTACAVRDILRKYRETHRSFAEFPRKVAIQMNDTHPTLAVLELMRTFLDDYDLPWEEAWALTVPTLGYTNHTLLPEALERWPVPLFERLLPRHLKILFEVNRRFLESVAELHPDDPEMVARVSIVEPGEPDRVRMAHLAILGSHAVNGVSGLHSELVKSSLVPDFHRLFPGRFQNKTNGVTPRRWLLLANPGLAALITRAIGPGWETDLERLAGLEPLADDAGFREELRRVKRGVKERLAPLVKAAAGFDLDPAALLDVQAKRIHEYKRPLLNLLHVIHRYLELVEDGVDTPPRTFLLAGKAAPGYRVAKELIRLAHAVAEVVNGDPRTRGLLKVGFVPDYRVSVAERLIPAADVSEQISTAGYEASGTGNMKFALNGALTVGTLDGANIEIRRAVGPENFFLFGRTADEIAALKRDASYHPSVELTPAIARVVEALRGDLLSPGAPGTFAGVAERIADRADPYFHLADLGDYLAAQRRVDEAWRDVEGWTRRSALTIARMGWFSSDRTIREYASEIWGIEPVV